jgi:hypothetical protein
MASSTKKTELIRKRHRRSCGKDRRHALQNKGSTPVFPIHPEKASSSDKSSQS